MATTNVFELIDRLAGNLPMTPSKVGELLGVPLKLDPAASGPMFDAYTAGHGKEFKSIELRAPMPDSGRQDALLIVVPADGGGVDRRQILDRYGLEFETQVPSPNGPADSPIAMRYARPWGEVSFGVSRDDAARLVRFVLKAG